MPCEACTNFFSGDFLCVNVPNGGTLQYGVQFQSISPGPELGQTSVFYKVCNCNVVPQTGISYVVFELCTGGITPIRVVVAGEEGTITNGEAIFGVPNFKVEYFGDVDAAECVTFQLIYDEVFGIESLQPGLFGVKIGGGPTSSDTTGSIDGLLVPCVVPVNCLKQVTAEVCPQATVSLEPIVSSRTPLVSCLDGPIIGECTAVPGFTPLPNTGVCTFTVSQVICVTVPLDFSVNVNATSSGGACGPVVPGHECPPIPT
ncbi:hypothetical protein [Paenisporosarcina cavernae]|uniref:Uncharacterized protein n=1 Tax=Paenisporosarcina cavernae TaxID=2320858 RepID=A0A385YXC8_9BACL|nr:hypothetical protein [Paenisporosarcina cavernae]AYC30213.1 hypothetical protein D3873_10145 [Paenisporosarcina cavernae]